ncbi:MAG: cation:proton antiporter, partial [Gemmatimonadales bacterium]
MIRRIVVLALLIGSALLLEPLRVPTEGVIAPRSLFLFGVLLLVADTLGTLMKGLGLPRIVGYLLAGMVLGPSVANMVPVEVLGDLGLMKQLALGLIGLLAGAELRMRDVQERWRGILYILLGQTLLVFLFVVPVTLLAREWIPFASGLSLSAAFTVALLFASMLALNSPMVTIALLTETGAQGPVAKTSLGVVLVADVLGIVLF